MKASKSVRKELYYTKDDEWIDFHGSVAYVGVCNAKLAGVKQIKKITFKNHRVSKEKVT